MHKFFLTSLGVLSLSVLATPNFAADAQNGAKLARKCSVCHGRQGIARDPEMPNLAGQSAFYLEKTLKEFRDGTRVDRRMTIVVRDLSDGDIKDLAAWFESFVISVEDPS